MKSLRKHLMPLQRRGLITVWSDTDIDAGTAWEMEYYSVLMGSFW